MPYGRLPAVGAGQVSTMPLPAFTRPYRFALWSVYHMNPLWKTGVCGSPMAGYSVIIPVVGFSFPIFSQVWPVYQMLSWSSGARPCGPQLRVGVGQSLVVPVAGSQ
jgi:hypothetical protein